MRVLWSRKALADLHRIWLFNADFDPDRADWVEECVKAEGEFLARHPTFGRRVDQSGRRHWTMPKLESLIRFRVYEERETLAIERVWHTRENREL